MSAPGIREPALALPYPRTGSETDEPSSGILTRQHSQQEQTQDGGMPSLSHRLQHNSSILALALGEGCIYAGTQGGEIVVYGLDTFQRLAVIEGHRGSVLGLCLSHDQKLLFSSAGDRTVNVWDTQSLTRVCCLFSFYDVGDIFCIAYSEALETVYIGSQNTTIQWCSIQQKRSSGCPRQDATVAPRQDPFFDSRGPGGVRTPRPADNDIVPKHAKGGEVIEISKENVRHFAHYGYVYSMLISKGFPEAAGHEVLVSCGGDGAVKIWNMDEANGAIDELYTLDDGREEGHSVLTIAIDGTFLYSGRSGGEVDVWDLETRQLVRNIKAHTDDVLTLCIGGGFLFTAAVNGYVRKFDRTYQMKSSMKAHDGRILASAFTVRQQRPIYVTGGNDDTVAVWDVSDCTNTQSTATKTSNRQLLDSLRRFVSYRTVSSDARHQVDCRRGASYLRSVFKNFGAATEMLSTQDPYNPVILARFKGNPSTSGERKKILFYGHYDVVAASDASNRWTADPFTMKGMDGYLYGRGTSDNKGPIMAAIFACAELMSERALGSDIVFLIEGEEETGSRGFEKAIQANKDKIGNIDWILLANSYWLDDQTPCLTYGLRGVVHVKVQIESSHPDMHSGVDGSAELDEPLKDLVMLLSTLTGKNGEVKVPGFYDPIPPLSEEERELYQDVTRTLLQQNPELGDPETLTKSLMRRWREASLTIHRFQTSGPDNATIIPHNAKAALSLRLVPNQEASEVAKALTSYLQAKFEDLGSHNRLTVTVDHQAEPWLGDWTNQIFKTLEEAIMEAWGPIDQGHRRRSSHLTVKSSEATENALTPKVSLTTSTVLASGGVVPPAQPMTPGVEIANQLEHAAPHSANKTTPAPPRKPLYIREGGSIPAIRFLEKEFDAPAAHFPCGQASDAAHLDNERFRLLNLYKSKDIFKKVFRELPQK